MAALVMDALKEHDWKPWEFEKTPNKWFQSTENVKTYVESLCAKLNIKGVCWCERVLPRWSVC